MQLPTQLYRANYFNYINMTSHDPSGMLRFLTDELQEAEDSGDRGTSIVICFVPRLNRPTRAAFIMGHVLSGWDGSNALGNPTDLCTCYFTCVRLNFSYLRRCSLSNVRIQNSMLGFVILKSRFAAWTAFHHTSSRGYSGVIRMKMNFLYAFNPSRRSLTNTFDW